MAEIRTSQRRRPGANIQTPEGGASVALQATRQATPQLKPEQDMRVDFSGFFGAIRSYVHQSEAADARARQVEDVKLKKEQVRIATLKASQGEDLTPEELDQDHMVAAHAVHRARKDAADFYGPAITKVIESVPLGENIQPAIENYLRETFGDGSLEGIEDDVYATSALEAIQPIIDAQRQTRSEALQKTVYAEGVRTLNASVAASTASGSIADDLPQLLEDSRKLHHLDPQRAKPELMYAIAANAKGNKANIEAARQAALSMDFDKTHPEAYAKFEEGLVNNWKDETTWESQQAVRGANDLLNASIEGGDVDTLMKFLEPGSGVLSLLEDRYGLVGGKVDAMRATAVKALDKIKENTLTNNHMTSWAIGASGDVDSSAVKKNLMGWFEANGVDLLSPEPVALNYGGQQYQLNPAQMLRNFGYEASDDMRNYLGRSLIQNSEQMGKTLTFLRGIANMPGADIDTAIKMLPQDQRNEARMLMERQDYLRQTDDELYVDLQNWKKAAGNAANYNWQNVFPDQMNAKGRGIEVINDTISSVADDLGIDASGVSPRIQAFLADEVLRHHVLNGQTGGSIQDSARHVVRNLITGGGVHVLDGTLVKSDFPSVYEGQPVYTMGGKIQNPHTGQQEDTVENWQSDASALKRRLEGLGYDGEVSLQTNAVTDSEGAYLVMKDDGMPVLLSEEQAAAFSLKPTADEQQLAGLRDDLLPAPNVDPDAPFEVSEYVPGMFALTYRVMPRIVPPTVEQKESAEADRLDRMRRTKMGKTVASDSGATTEGGFWSWIQGKVLGQRRQEQTVTPGTGVTKGTDTIPSSLDDVLRTVEGWNQDQKKRSGPRAFEPVETPPSATYNHRRYESLRGHEGERLWAYDDQTGKQIAPGQASKGLVTVGIGFNMDKDGARKEWAEAGLDPKSFDAVKSGRKKLTQQESRALFDVSVEAAERVVDQKLGDAQLTEHQRLTLVSLAFNNPSLIGPNLTAQVKSGDWGKAIDEILYQSNWKKVRGLAKRRWAEAYQFAGEKLRHLIPDYQEYLRSL